MDTNIEKSLSQRDCYEKNKALKDDIDHYYFQTGKIQLYDYKISFAFEHTKPKEYRKKIYKSHDFQILGICDDESRFVVNPKNSLQITKNGGTLKLLRLEKGYEISAHVKESEKGVSGEVGVEVAGTGVTLAIDNSRMRQFKMKLGKLTHEHLVMITDTEEPVKGCGFLGCGYRDTIKVKLDYIKIMPN